MTLMRPLIEVPPVPFYVGFPGVKTKTKAASGGRDGTFSFESHARYTYTLKHKQKAMSEKRKHRLLGEKTRAPKMMVQEEKELKAK